jgi:anti-anti-sigma factor
MSVTKTTLDNAGGINLKVTGEFGVNLSKSFHSAYAGTAKPGLTYRIDLSKVSSIDSAGLWILVEMTEYAHANGAKVKIIGASEVAKKAVDLEVMKEAFDITENGVSMLGERSEP